MSLQAMTEGGLGWLVSACDHPAVTLREWTRYPRLRMQIPVGRIFDVVDVPLELGINVLNVAGQEERRNGTRLLGPISTEGQRILFLVEAGTTSSLRSDVAQLGIRTRGVGEFMMAPPLEIHDNDFDRWLTPPMINPTGREPSLSSSVAVVGLVRVVRSMAPYPRPRTPPDAQCRLNLGVRGQHSPYPS